MKAIRRTLTPLNFHLAALAVLAIVVLVLAVKAVLAVHAAGAVNSASYQQQRVRAVELRAQLAHIQNLPQKVNDARDAEAHFVQERIAPNYSTIAQELGQAAIQNDVRLSRAQYTPSAPIDGIVEVRIDAGLSGGYVPMMKFINTLERDKNHVLFIIDDLAFTGQQGGLVNLRLRVSAYLQAGATDLPPAPPAQQQAFLQSPHNASLSKARSAEPNLLRFLHPVSNGRGSLKRSPLEWSTPALLASQEVR